MKTFSKLLLRSGILVAAILFFIATPLFLEKPSTEKSGFSVYANPNGAHDLCSNQNEEQNAQDYSEWLGLNRAQDCPTFDNGTCTDPGYGTDCLRRCQIAEPGVSLDDCEWDCSPTDTNKNVRCDLSENISDYWNDYLTSLRGGCDRCMDLCWYHQYVKGDADMQTCQTNGIPNVTHACKTSHPNYMEGSCIYNWADDWSGAMPTTPDGQRELACQTYCYIADTDTQGCKDDCLAKGNLQQIADFANGNITPEQIAAASGKTTAGALKDLIFGDPLNTDVDDLFEQIPGGFGYGKAMNVPGFVSSVLETGYFIMGGLAIIKILFGAVMYATAAGNPDQITKAKSHIYYALIGTLVLMGAGIILTLLGAGPFAY